jgi:hypothetical protein
MLSNRMDNAMTPPASNKKRKTKAFPSGLANVTDDNRSRFGMALELDPNPKSNTFFGSEFLVAQTVTVKVKDRDVPFQLKSVVVDHLHQLSKNVGVVNCGSSNSLVVKSPSLL